MGKIMENPKKIKVSQTKTLRISNQSKQKYLHVRQYEWGSYLETGFSKRFGGIQSLWLNYNVYVNTKDNLWELSNLFNPGGTSV